MEIYYYIIAGLIYFHLEMLIAISPFLFNILSINTKLNSNTQKL